MKPETDENQSSIPPKLSLFSLPRQPPEPPGLLTPPLHASVSVPFQWEEAPGKPRPFSFEPKPKTARSLDLPPRLFSDTKVAHYEPPTSAVDEPAVEPDLSSTLSFRFPDSWEETQPRQSMDGKNLGSRRWGSFRKNKENLKGSFAFSLSDGGADGGDGVADTKVKITRFRSKRSLLGSSSSKSHLMASIYESLKQVIPWRRRQGQVKKASQ